MAERRARLRQQGWSALTHAHREAPSLQGPLIPSFSPELSVPDLSQFTPLSLHPLPPNPPTTLSFAGVVKQPLGSASFTPLPAPIYDDCTNSYFDPSHSRAQAVSRLHAHHPWADATLISDILQTLGFDDEESASALLVSMSDDNIERVSAVTDTECCCSLQLDDDDKELCGRAWATEETSFGADAEPHESAKGRDLFGCIRPVPTEPEWEEDDLYFCNRRDALKMSRYLSALGGSVGLIF